MMGTAHEIVQEAAVRGVPVRVVAVQRARDALAARKPAEFSGRAVWARIPLDVRCLLVTTCTERDNIENAAAMRWESFTDGERVRMGAAARAIREGLSSADWLR